jgi:hypothetical protein
MGNETYSYFQFKNDSNVDEEKIKSIYKIDCFEKKNLKIKKIVCGGIQNYDSFYIFLTGLNIKFIEIFLNLKIKILVCGKLFGVGNNFSGCMGDGTTESYFEIKQIDFFSNIFISDVVCGNDHCLSISKKGEIFAWGSNQYGKNGNGERKWNSKQLNPIKIFKIKKNDFI